MNKLFLFSLLGLAFGCGDTDKSTDNAPGWTFGSTMLERPDPNNGVILDAGMDVDGNNDQPEPTGDLNGEPCNDSTICAGGTCFASFPDGYCSEIACDGACEFNGTCVEFEGDELCAADCATDLDCRDGYICTDDNVCLPGARTVDGAPDGEGCGQDSDCAGGFCITDWPGGYCTTVNCDTFEDCARGDDGDLNNRCFQQQDGNFCARICTRDDECREDYVCQPISRRQGLCAPDPSTPIDPNVIANLAFDLTCVVPTANGQIEYDYTIAADTTAYQITPLNIDGKDLQPQNIALPDGTFVDFRGKNSFQGVGAQLYGGMNPTVVPAIPQFTNDLQSGAHRYQLATASDETCFYQVEETEPGTILDLNIYLVGVQGVTAANAETNVNMQESLTKFSEIYAGAGLTIGKITYTDITGANATRFSVVRSEADLSELVALSKPVGPTKNDALTMNVFFVRSFALGDAIGISLGLPGPAGLHGTKGSGVAFTTEFLGQQIQDQDGQLISGNDLTAQVLAHEIGHYLGLFHTTEQSGQHDPLNDTPECQRISLNCPDLNNLMFPFAGREHTIITPAQSFVLGVHPLTKTVTP